MIASATRQWRRILALVLGLMMAAPAQAFFPFGGWDSFEVLRFVRWPLVSFDNNNDGRVEPDDGDGLELIIEGGSRGFTDEEIDVVLESLQVWQDVPSSYASFQIRGITEDPILAGSGAQPDGLPTIVMQVSEFDAQAPGVEADPADVAIPDVAFPVLGVNALLFLPEDAVVNLVDRTVFLSAGTIVDSDIIINATAHRQDPVTGAPPLVDLKGTMVHEIGHFLGFGHTPLNNLRPETNTPGSPLFTTLVESPVFPLTGADGVQQLIGVTPTMYPIFFSVENNEGRRFAGGADLAPDDISAVSWNYPRGSQANFFTVASDARSEVRVGSGLINAPLIGGHVVAWANHDNDPNTPRIPLFSTMVGLYESPLQVQLGSRFQLRGMWKTTEIPGQIGGTFAPDYVFTLSPLNGTGFQRQAPEGQAAADLDSTHLASLSVLTRGADDYINAFPSVVFNEVENLLDVNNREAGTPFVWDFERNTIVSTDSGDTLSTVLVDRPMFGDEDDACPFNIIEGGGGGVTPAAGGIPGSIVAGNQTLRSFRDRVMMQNAAGAWVAQSYYQFAPSFAQFLQERPLALTLWKGFVVSLFWSMNNYLLILASFGGLAALALIRRRKRILIAAARSATLVLAFALLTIPAQAQIAYVTTSELAAGADAIITGKVLSTDSRWARGGRIFTDVILEVEDSVKGQVNKQSTITLQVLGGSVNGVVMHVSELPTFRPEDEVLLHVRELSNGAYVTYGGNRGKMEIRTSKSGERLLVGGSIESDRALAADSVALLYRLNAIDAAHSKKDSDDEEDGDEAEENDDDVEGLPLDLYLDYLKELVREQASKP